MGEEGAPALYTTDDTGNYVEYTPPEPPAFHETLPEDLRESDHLKDVKDGDQLARYYVDMKSNLKVPPSSADGYEFQKPDGFNVDENAFKEFKTMAFENDITQAQFGELMKLEVSRHTKALEAVKQNQESYQQTAEVELKTEWGDNYEKNRESAKNLLNHEVVSDAGFKKFLEDTRFGDNPQVIRFFSKLAGLISEDAFKKPGTGDGGNESERTEDGRPMLKFHSMEE